MKVSNLIPAASLAIALMTTYAWADKTGQARQGAATQSTSPPSQPLGGSPAVKKQTPGWYGSELLLIYAGSAATCIGGALVANAADLKDGDLLLASTCTLGALGYVSAGFIAHGRRGYWKKAWVSLALSIGLPAVGIMMGANGNDGFGAIGTAIVGLIGGAIITPIYDVAWQAYHPVDRHTLMPKTQSSRTSVYGLKLSFSWD